MMRHYHLINCDSNEVMANFINSGFVGVRPVLTSSQNLERQIRDTVRMNWDILADLARVKTGDYIMLHTSGVIKGVFEVVGSPLVIQALSHLFDGPNIDTKNWSNNWTAVKQQIDSHSPIWMIPIKPHNEIYFKEMSMDVVFDSISRGIITSLPQRLRYEDKNKTTKGLTENDFEVILRLFYNYSFIENGNTQSSSPSNLVPVTFDYLCIDGYEKNLEALVVHRIRSGTFGISGVRFSHSNVLNMVPLGYLKMADLLTWDEKNGEIINPWIWELKVNSLSWNALKEEIKKLSQRASYLSTFFKTSQESFKVTGIVVAPNFSGDAINKFRELITPIGVVEELLLVKYHETGQNVQFTLVGRV